MRTTHYLFLSGLLLTLTFGVAQAQINAPRCGTNAESEDFRRLALRTKSPPQSTSGRLSAEPTRVAIKTTLLLGSGGVPPTQATLDTVLAYLNTYFNPLNITFYWLGQPTHVRDNKYANTYNFDVFRATTDAYNVDNAINLYFGLVSAYGNGSSFASLPTLQNSSNYVYINSLLPNGPNDVNYLTSVLRYVIPHEFGHYFGLDHTFINSKSTAIAERELVTRGPGANCASRGDLICDTPADPYERLISGEIVSWQINGRTCQLEAPLSDASGASFTPDVQNFMSYYYPFLKDCTGGLRFSPGQYERMRLGLAVRLGYSCYGREAYTITGPEAALPRVSIDRIAAIDNGTVTTTNVQMVCLGATVRIAYSTSGRFQPGETFQVERTFDPFANQKLVPDYTPIPSEAVAGQPGQLTIRIADSSLIYLLPFSIRLRPALTPAIYCVNPTSFRTVPPGTVRIGFDTTPADTMTVDFGQSVSLRVRPEKHVYGQAYGSGRLLVNEERIPYSTLGKVAGDLIPVTFYKNSKIRLFDALVGCGFVNLLGNLAVAVRPPVLTLQLPTLILCAGASLTLPFTTLPTPGISQGYRAQISDATGHFRDDSTGILGSADQSPMGIRVPASLPGGSSYRIRLLVNTPQGWVAALPGSPIQISALPTALLTASPVTLMTGDSARLTIQLTGLSPWLVQLSNGQSLTLTSPQSSVLVKPVKTTVYQLTAVQNACGAGSVGGTTTITVLQPLATEPPTNKPALRLWPNPAGTDLTIEFRAPVNQFVSLRLTDLSGKPIQTISKQGTGYFQRHYLTVSDLPAGIYQFSLDGPDGGQTLRFLKQ